MNKIVMLATLLMLVFLMMGLGVTMEPKKILKFAKRPVGATIATAVQFGLMPFVAYGLGLAFQMDEIKMLTMIILGCCPGGTLSNFMGEFCTLFELSLLRNNVKINQYLFGTSFGSAIIC